MSTVKKRPRTSLTDNITYQPVLATATATAATQKLNDAELKEIQQIHDMLLNQSFTDDEQDEEMFDDFDEREFIKAEEAASQCPAKSINIRFDDQSNNRELAAIVGQYPLDQTRHEDSGKVLDVIVTQEEQDKSSERSNKSDQTFPVVTAEVDEDSCHTSLELGQFKSPTISNQFDGRSTEHLYKIHSELSKLQIEQKNLVEQIADKSNQVAFARGKISQLAHDNQKLTQRALLSEKAIVEIGQKSDLEKDSKISKLENELIFQKLEFNQLKSRLVQSGSKPIVFPTRSSGFSQSFGSHVKKSNPSSSQSIPFSAEFPRYLNEKAHPSVIVQKLSSKIRVVTIGTSTIPEIIPIAPVDPYILLLELIVKLPIKFLPAHLLYTHLSLVNIVVSKPSDLNDILGILLPPSPYSVSILDAIIKAGLIPDNPPLSLFNSGLFQYCQSQFSSGLKSFQMNRVVSRWILELSLKSNDLQSRMSLSFMTDPALPEFIRLGNTVCVREIVQSISVLIDDEYFLSLGIVTLGLLCSMMNLLFVVSMNVADDEDIITCFSVLISYRKCFHMFVGSNDLIAAVIQGFYEASQIFITSLAGLKSLLLFSYIDFLYDVFHNDNKDGVSLSLIGYSRMAYGLHRVKEVPLSLKKKFDDMLLLFE